MLSVAQPSRECINPRRNEAMACISAPAVRVSLVVPCLCLPSSLICGPSPVGFQVYTRSNAEGWHSSVPSKYVGHVDVTGKERVLETKPDAARFFVQFCMDELRSPRTVSALLKPSAVCLCIILNMSVAVVFPELSASIYELLFCTGQASFKMRRLGWPSRVACAR